MLCGSDAEGPEPDYQWSGYGDDDDVEGEAHPPVVTEVVAAGAHHDGVGLVAYGGQKCGGASDGDCHEEWVN